MSTSFGKYGDHVGDGQQPPRALLPHMLDQAASTDPDAVYGMWPVIPASYEQGFRSVTFAQFANVVNGLAQWLVESLGGAGSGRGREVLAYVGPNDVRTPALTLAAAKTGYAGAGLGQTHLYAIPFGNTVIAPAATAIVTAQGLVDALGHTPADVALLVPSVVAELAQNPDLLSAVARHLELIVYIGGDLPQAVGDIVAAQVPLRCQWGASEVGMPQQLIPAGLDPRRDWKYLRFHPCAGAVFERVTDDDGGLYELVIRKQEALSSTQPTFTIRGKEHLAEYRTRDLFAPHPSVPDAWAWRARADDIVVFLNGEKTNPVTMEHHVVARNPGLLAGALVVGTHRFQAALLLEPVAPVQSTAEQADLIERVWPSIQEANRAAPAHARVEKALVFVADPDRPLVRAGKGTLQRGASATLYQAEINALYDNAEKADHDDEEESTIVDEEALGDMAVVTRRIRDAVLKVTDWTDPLAESDSLFERGMDSLQALRLTRALRRALHLPQLGLSTVYQNPTISELAAAVTTTQGDSERDDRDIMEPLLTTYRQLIKEIPVSEAASSSLGNRETPRDVLLTGSTGTLGTMILRALLLNREQGTGHVYCLNRATDGGQSAQTKKWAALNDVDASLLEEHVTFLQANLAHPRLGLDPEMYEKLRSQVGLVIHSAWPVNFNLALSSFRPQLAGMVNLFSLAASAGVTHRMRVLFISSVGAVAATAGSRAPAPESIIDSLDAAHGNGYSRSKLMSELLCDTASQHLDISVSIARVGQVAGPANDHSRGVVWNRSEWLPSLVISSFHLGCLPDNLGPRFSLVDWMPSDMVAEVIVELAVATTVPETHQVETKNRNGSGSRGRAAQVFNLRNPQTTRWDALLPALQDAARQHLGKELEVVPPSSWLQRLKESSEQGDTDHATDFVARNPAIKLLAFYHDGLWADGPDAEPMSVDKSSQASEVLQNMPAVNDDWMRKWVEDWLVAS
ncbi:NRPS-like enzyme [Apiospora kogelbergensis]|uniref:NRPS-like enzyme n=1 Tax=Apiospora kogelbergensis TaxID=1337665 RepID=UPI00312EB179